MTRNVDADHEYPQVCVQQMYTQMFAAYNSMKPSTRDLYREMFAAHGIPFPRGPVQQPQGTVTLDGNTPNPTSIQRLYRQMFATHGIPTPRPGVQPGRGCGQASAAASYRQMFAAHGFPTPIAFQGYTPGSSPIPDLYRQMFEAHGDRLGGSAAQNVVLRRRAHDRSGAQNAGMAAGGVATANDDRANNNGGQVKTK